MDIKDLTELDSIWDVTFPYIVTQIMDNFSTDHGSVLEMGPFSGGVAVEMAKQYPGLDITIAEENAEVAEYIRGKISACGFNDIQVKRMEMDNLAFGEAEFDLVIFRGALFFMHKMEGVLGEICRVMKKGGFAIVGGGHGKGVPRHVIERISPELRRLHAKLGGRKVSAAELQAAVEKSGMSSRCQVVEEGGVWIYFHK